MSKLKISYHDNLLVNTTNSGTYNLATAEKLMIDNIKFELGDTQLQETTIKAGANNITALPIDPYEGFSKVTIEHPDLYEGATKLNDFETSEWWDSFAQGNAPSGNVILSDDITSISTWSFYGRKKITGFSAQSITSVPVSAFDACANLSMINLPNVVTVGNYGFRNCLRLNNVYLPKCTTLSGFSFYGAGQINSNTGIWVFPKITAVPSDCFRQIGAETVDLGPDCASLGTRAIYQPSYGGYISNLILRKSDSIVTAAATNSLDKLNASTKVYVPQALIEDYKNATNWSTKGEIFYPIEGSEFEHYYANGVAIEEGE